MKFRLINWVVPCFGLALLGMVSMLCACEKACSKESSTIVKQADKSVSADLPNEEPYTLDLASLRVRAQSGLEYCKKNNMNTQWMMLADMSVHSGRNRFFAWDFAGDSILKSGLVSHGCGNFWWGTDQSKTKPVFSNVPESHCSSLGKYKIGKRGWSNFGIHVNYKMHGLDSSNSNALKRYIVLHSWEVVPEDELYPAGTPEGWGCPAVSDAYIRYLDKKLKASKKPVLLWMF